jgi:hypothetical protein
MTTKSKSNPSKFVETAIRQPVQRLYLRQIEPQSAILTAEQHTAVRRQAIIGWLQTLVLIVMLFQVIFAGLMRALPPDVRSSLAFLHRIEWGAYTLLVLIAAHIVVSVKSRIVLSNRFYLLAWRLGAPKLVTGSRARYLQLAYTGLMILIIVAILWVRVRGFLVQPVP